MLLSSDAQSSGVFIKGIIPEMEARLSALSQNIVQGSLSDFHEDSIVIGNELAKTLGVTLGDRVKVVSLGTLVTPLGLAPRSRLPQISAIFSPVV